MDFEDNLREALSYKFNSIETPQYLKERILGKNGTRNRKFSFGKKLLVACLVLSLSIPVLGFGYIIFADRIYGNYENASKYGITEPEYLRFNNKLSNASQILSPREFTEFIVLAKDLVFFMLKHGDTSTTDRTKFGQVNVKKLTPEQRKEYEIILNRIQPYFDKLNNGTNTTGIPPQPGSPQLENGNSITK